MRIILRVITALLFVSGAVGSADLSWEMQIRPLADTIQPAEYWETAESFRPRQDVTVPADIADGTRMMVFKSNFTWAYPEDASIHISPSDHPCRIFINGQKIYQFGMLKNPYVASNYRSVLTVIPPSVMKKGKNSIVLILYPRGNRSAPPAVTIDSYLPNSQREFWQTSFNYSFIVGHWITGILLFLMFTAFWFASHRTRHDFLCFALTSLFLALAYLNVVFASPAHNEPALWITARSSMTAAAVSLMIFISIQAGTFKQFRLINLLFIFMAAVFFFNVLLMKSKYEIDAAFSAVTNIILTPALILTFYHSIYKLIKSRSIYDLLIVAGVITTFGTALYDMYFFKNQMIPFCWTLAYGYASLEIILVIVLTRDLWKLYQENRDKAHLLEEKNLELEQQKQKLQQLSSGKSRFLKNMAHEFNTPLQGIIAAADLLNQHDTNHISLKNLMNALNLQMRKHLYSIQNVMDLSIIEDKLPDIHEKPFEISSLISSIEIMFCSSEHNISNRLTVHCENSMPALFHGDQDHIARITVNLLTNIIADKTAESISCTFLWNEIPGILEIKMNSSTGKIHPRTVEILSSTSADFLTEYSESSEIDDLAVFAASKLITLVKGEMILNNSRELILKFPLKVLESKAAASVGSSKILVVEDNPVNRMLIQKILEKLGCTVVTAEDGKEAVERAVTEDPSLIFMDVQMPIMDGIEATKRIRASHSDVVIIALTANADRSECIQAGMNDFLHKPAQMQELKKIIDHYLSPISTGEN